VAFCSSVTGNAGRDARIVPCYFVSTPSLSCLYVVVGSISGILDSALRTLLYGFRPSEGSPEWV